MKNSFDLLGDQNNDLDDSKCSCLHDKDDKVLSTLELDKRILSFNLHEYEDNTLKDRKITFLEDDNESKVTWMEFYLRIFYDKNNLNKTREKLFRINFIVNQSSKFIQKNLLNNGGIYFHNLPKRLNPESSNTATINQNNQEDENSTFSFI